MATFQRDRPGVRMLPVEEAQAAVMSSVAVLGAEEVAFDESFGRVLREDVTASVDAPERDNSAMDGYAVRVSDLPGSLRVIGDIPAGRLPEGRVEPGTAMRIMTGAFVPDGADTVVQVELTDAGSEIVEIRQAISQGANIRRRGEDMRAGDLLLRAGTRIGAAEIAVLAGVQKSVVRVGRRPTVAILSTGDELIGVADPRASGMIVNTNEYLLTALVREAGAIPRPLGIVRDTPEATVGALASASSSDFVLTSGGVSAGAFDFVKDALDALGAETKFWQVAMKPGKPVVLSRLPKSGSRLSKGGSRLPKSGSRRGESLCFGLPGNPVSCFVSFHLFVAPALRKAAGQSADLFPPSVRARLTAPLRAADRRVYFRVRVTAEDGSLVATPRATQGSGSLTSMLSANGLAQVEAGTALDAGADVPVLLIGPVSHP